MGRPKGNYIRIGNSVDRRGEIGDQRPVLGGGDVPEVHRNSDRVGAVPDGMTPIRVLEQNVRCAGRGAAGFEGCDRTVEDVCGEAAQVDR
jgi:hypothetical protein